MQSNQHVGISTSANIKVGHGRVETIALAMRVGELFLSILTKTMNGALISKRNSASVDYRDHMCLPACLST